jgi:hypothetical protein
MRDLRSESPRGWLPGPSIEGAQSVEAAQPQGGGSGEKGLGQLAELPVSLVAQGEGMGLVQSVASHIAVSSTARKSDLLSQFSPPGNVVRNAVGLKELRVAPADSQLGIRTSTLYWQETEICQ